ncbi:MAG TPA: DinB family protein [Candidatus Limnocylindria bacterium]|nr:DinB family protein [Candidatus Limnocylindria bacterium]
MAIRDAFLPEFSHEMATARKTLERVPEGKAEWAPHPRSMKMGRLAGHIAELPGLVATALSQDLLDFRPPGAQPRTPYVMTTREALLQVFDKNVSAASAAIAGVSDESLMKTFTLAAGGKVIFALPRLAALRSFVLNHVIHHRGQLSVYLRLNDVPVPSIYGPSADEGQL